ncbi:MAG: ABC transporter permease [Vulcanimicrobiaceae bacterium]
MDAHAAHAVGGLIVGSLFSWRRWLVLTRKEFVQILGNRQVLFILIFPPIVQVTILGYALNPLIGHLAFAVADESKSPASRQLIDAFTVNGVFVPERAGDDAAGVYGAVQSGAVDAGLVIPADYARNRARGAPSDVQFVFDGVNSFVANLGAGYASSIVQEFNARGEPGPPLAPQIIFAYNPGLVTAWFFIPGLLGAILMITGLLASASGSVREKDEGTLEQLLMTPASSLEVLLAKIGPLFVLFVFALLASLAVSRLVFGLPFHGDFLLFLSISSVYIVAAISIGILISTFVATQQQAVLISIFTALPLMMLSGAFAPVESMPPFWQTLSLINPLRHYITILRDILLKGAGLEVIWPNVLALVGFAVVAIWISATRYRSQLR